MGAWGCFCGARSAIFWAIFRPRSAIFWGFTLKMNISPPCSDLLRERAARSMEGRYCVSNGINRETAIGKVLCLITDWSRRKLTNVTNVTVTLREPPFRVARPALCVLRGSRKQTEKEGRGWQRAG